MDKAKLISFLRVLLPVSIFFICGVLGFATKGVPSPVFKTLELMVIVVSSGYLIYRIDPKPKAGKTMIRSKDLLQLGVVFVGGLLAVYVVQERWEVVKLFQFACLLVVSTVGFRLVGRVKLIWLKTTLTILAMFCLLVGFSYVFTPNVNWVFVASYSIMSPLMRLAESKKKDLSVSPTPDEDPLVVKGIAKF